MVDIRIIQIKTNAQNLYGWIALSSTDHPIGHIFMHVEFAGALVVLTIFVSTPMLAGYGIIHEQAVFAI